MDYSATITPEAEPKKDGYKFSGWSYIPSKMPAEDVVLQAVIKVKGDIDGDGELSVTDVVQLVNAVMNPSNISDIKKYDMDGDGELSVTDVVFLVNSAMNN